MKTQIGEIYIQCNGAVAGTPEAPTWHVQVVDVAETIAEAEQIGGIRRVRTLSMEQAASEGIDLPKAFSLATGEIMRRAENAEASLKEARASHEAYSDEMNGKLAEAQAAVEARDAKIEQMTSAAVEAAPVVEEPAAPTEKKSLLNMLSFGMLK